MFVCGFTLNMVATAATTDTLFFEQGTGGACAAPAALTATYSSGVLSAGATNLVVGYAGNSIFQTTTGAFDLCAVSAVGTTPAIALDISFVQQ